MSREFTFQGDIDNQTHIKEVSNFLIGPVFPHPLSFEGDTSEDYDRSQPIGILQLINKNNFEEVTDADVQKFKAIQDLLGLSIDKTSETQATVNVRIGVQKNLGGMDAIIGDPKVRDNAFGVFSKLEDAKHEFQAVQDSLERRAKENLDAFKHIQTDIINNQMAMRKEDQMLKRPRLQREQPNDLE